MKACDLISAIEQAMDCSDSEEVLCDGKNIVSVKNKYGVIRIETANAKPPKSGGIVSRDEVVQNSKFEKPEISHDEYINWIHKNLFLASEEGISLSRRILENYINSVEQFINDPNSMAAKCVFEIATQTVKKYISCF